jgi:hypothetical protein
VQLGLWRGDLTLQNLRLRSDALERLVLLTPLSVHEGSLGHIHLQVHYPPLFLSHTHVDASMWRCLMHPPVQCCADPMGQPDDGSGAAGGQGGAAVCGAAGHRAGTHAQGRRTTSTRQVCV